MRVWSLLNSVRSGAARSPGLTPRQEAVLSVATRVAAASAVRLRNSLVAELLLIVLVYAVGILVIRRTQFALDINSWYASAAEGQLRLTYAGWWGALVAMPVVQFLCVRWFFRFFVWGRFLWQVSRIHLNLEPAHPDCTAGLHFIALTERACRMVLLGMGAVGLFAWAWRWGRRVA